MFAILVMVCCQATAQSVTVLSNNRDAQNCYRFARMASQQTKVAGIYNESSCDRALELDLFSLDRVAVYVNRGIIRAANGDYPQALADYKAALAILPEQPEALANIGNLLFIDGQYAKAMELYDRSLELNIRDNHVIHLNRGMLHEKLGHLEAAEADYTKAIELKPEWQFAKQKLEQLQARLAPVGPR